jgi:hypothetical protein
MLICHPFSAGFSLVVVLPSGPDDQSDRQVEMMFGIKGGAEDLRLSGTGLKAVVPVRTGAAATQLSAYPVEICLPAGLALWTEETVVDL